MRCPVCGKKTEVIITTREIPHFGSVVISVAKCKCGFRHTDIFEVETAGNRTTEIKIDSQKKLNALVIRSSTGKISIKEYGLEISPGPFSQGFITTVEGVLNRFEEISSLFEEKTEIMKLIEELKAVRRPFTLRIEDPRGLSTIIYSEE